MSDTIYIVSGNYSEFLTYTQKRCSNREFYRYVDSVKSLMGLTEIKGFFIGTWRTRPDIEELKSQIAIIKSKKHVRLNPSTILP